MSRIVQLFDRPCCGPSVAQSLREFLAERVGGDIQVDYHDLNNTSSEPISVPTAVVQHLQAGGGLPIMTVDGHVVAAGALPNLMDALDLATGRAPMAGPRIELAGGTPCC